MGLMSTPESRAAKTIREVFESGRPLTYIRTTEEQRAGRILREVASRMSGQGPLPVWTWSLTEGLHRDGEAAEPGTHDPRGVLDYLNEHSEPGIFHLKDFHEALRESAEVRRRLRDLYESCRDQREFIVITSPVRSIPEEVERSVLFLELRTPDIVELVAFLRDEAQRIPTNERYRCRGRRCRGSRWMKRGHALRRAQANGRLGPESLPALLEEKRHLVNRSGVIEFIPRAPISARSGASRA